MNEPVSRWSQDNRDLLIELKTKMDAIQADLNDLKGNYTARILNLESNAVNRISFDDHETRIRFIERYVWAALGILAAGEFAINFFWK